MRRTIVFSVILFAIAISGNLHSAGNEGRVTPRVTPEDYYCGYEEEIQDCTWVLEGSQCIATSDCHKLEVTPPED